MPDFILLMHNDTVGEPDAGAWDDYFARLRAAGAFVGGSAIGGGESLRKDRVPAAPTLQIAGLIRVQTSSFAEAEQLVAGNPVYENGGTVEVRALPED